MSRTSSPTPAGRIPDSPALDMPLVRENLCCLASHRDRPHSQQPGPHVPHAFRALGAFALVAGIHACSRPPEPVRYELRTVNGGRLPATLAFRDNCQHLLVEAAIVFPGDRTYQSGFKVQILCPGQQRPIDGPALGSTGRVEQAAGDTIFFVDGNSGTRDRARIVGDSLIVQSAQRRLAYTRTGR